MGTLFVVATPIGNLEDVSFRALAVLRAVDLIAAEDTRRTRKLLSRYNIPTPLTSYYEHNKLVKLDYLIATMQTKDVALVSDAGMPGISDPGYELVRAAIAASIKIVPIPGPSALMTALAVSGLPSDQFVFIGFLPRRSSERRTKLKSLANETRTMVTFEAPHRLVTTLADISQIFGDRPMCVARELTKMHEEILHGSVSEMEAHFTATPPLGEFTLVIGGASAEQPPMSDEDIIAQLESLVKAGASGKEAVDRVATATGHPRKRVYRLYLDIKQRLP